MYQTASEWRAAWGGDLAAWRDRQATRKAMCEFDALGGLEVDRYVILRRIGLACLYAMRYRPEDDPSRVWRDDMAHERDRLSDLATAARVLANACERGDVAMMWALPGGANPLGAALSRPHDGKKVDICRLGAAWFRELENTLNGQLPGLHGGPWWHRFHIGNLHFDEALGAGRPVEVASMLAFELTFYLRMFSAGRARDVVAAVSPMPKDGRPCGHIVAGFCNATLGTNLDARQIADRLRKLKSARLVPWGSFKKAE